MTIRPRCSRRGRRRRRRHACEETKALILRNRAQHGVLRLSKDEGWPRVLAGHPSFETAAQEGGLLRMRSEWGTDSNVPVCYFVKMNELFSPAQQRPTTQTADG